MAALRANGHWERFFTEGILEFTAGGVLDRLGFMLSRAERSVDGSRANEAEAERGFYKAAEEAEMWRRKWENVVAEFKVERDERLQAKSALEDVRWELSDLSRSGGG